MKISHRAKTAGILSATPTTSHPKNVQQSTILYCPDGRRIQLKKQEVMVGGKPFIY